MLALATMLDTLWSYLDTLPTLHNLLWFFTGVFNELFSCADKNRGSMVGRFGGLKKWVERSAMVDMGY